MPRKKKAEQLALPETGGVSLASLQPQMDATRADAEGLLRSVSSLPMDAQDQLDWLASAGRLAQDDLDRLEEEQKKITKPINDGLKATRDFFRPGKDACEAVVTCVKTRLSEFVHARRKALDAAATAGEHAALAALPQLPTLLEQRSVLEFEVVDISLVPREYMRIDEDLVKARLKDADEKEEFHLDIPGLRVVRSPTLRWARRPT